MSRSIFVSGEWSLMPNFREWTATEIVVQLPAARNILAKHFGPEGIKSASGFRLRELAKRKGVDLDVVMGELNAAAKSTGMFT